MKLFDLDGPIYRIGTEIADFLILAMYWFFCCLPVVTIGASTSSLFYVFGKKMRGEDTYVTRDFFKSFKQNFKQSIPLTILLGVLWVSTIAYWMMLIGYQGNAPFYLRVLTVLFSIETFLFTIYSTAILSRFYMKFKQIVLSSFVLAHRHLLTSILIIVSFFVIYAIAVMMPMLLLFIPVFVVAFSSYLLQKIFNVHIKAAEDLKEAEANQVGQADESERDDEEDDEEETQTEQVDSENKEAVDNQASKETDEDFLKYI